MYVAAFGFARQGTDDIQSTVLFESRKVKPLNLLQYGEPLNLFQYGTGRPQNLLTRVQKQSVRQNLPSKLGNECRLGMECMRDENFLHVYPDGH